MPRKLNPQDRRNTMAVYMAWSTCLFFQPMLALHIIRPWILTFVCAAAWYGIANWLLPAKQMMTVRKITAATIDSEIARSNIAMQICIGALILMLSGAALMLDEVP